MKRYALTLDERQARVLIECLDFFSRIGMGQLEEVAALFHIDDPRIDKDRHDLDIAKDMLQTIKSLLFQMGRGQHYGIHNPNVPEKYRVAWDVMKVVRHQLWQDTPDRLEHIVDSDVPTPSCPQPLAQIERVADVPEESGKPKRNKRRTVGEEKA